MLLPYLLTLSFILRNYFITAGLADTALKKASKCSCTRGKLRFLILFCLVSPMLARYETASSLMVGFIADSAFNPVPEAVAGTV